LHLQLLGKYVEKLKESVERVYIRSRPSPDIIEKRNLAFELVSTLIVESNGPATEYSYYGPMDLVTYGSIKAGLDTVSSDIDISLQFPFYGRDAEFIKSNSAKILDAIVETLMRD
jgi:DNA polymerase sigma